MASEPCYTVIKKGDKTHAMDVWRLKERIREERGIFKQSKDYFVNRYKHLRGYIAYIVTNEDNKKVVGFTLVDDDGYIGYLGVDANFRGEECGTDLVSMASSDFNTLSCHVRSNNESAIHFYQNIGFDIEKKISEYYKNRDDAFLMKSHSKDNSI